MEGSNELDKACKKLKQQVFSHDLIDRLKKLDLNPNPSPFEELRKKKPEKPNHFDNNDDHVFLLKKVDREVLRKQFRDDDISEIVGKRRSQMLSQSRLFYFDEQSNKRKPLLLEDLNTADFSSRRTLFNQILLRSR